MSLSPKSSSQKSSQSSMKKSLDSLKSSKERRLYAGELMEKVKGHIPVVLQAHKDFQYEIPDSNKV